jgi:hypothetical protein
VMPRLDFVVHNESELIDDEGPEGGVFPALSWQRAPQPTNIDGALLTTHLLRPTSSIFLMSAQRLSGSATCCAGRTARRMPRAAAPGGRRLV